MESTYSSQVAAEVRAAFARAGKGRNELASIIGVTRPTASARWAGSQPYTLDELATIADALHISVASLVLPEVPPHSDTAA